MWYLKRDEQTFLLKVWSMIEEKVEETSPVSQKGQTLVEVKDVRACKGSESKVEVVFKNLQEPSGKSSLKFGIKDYKYYGVDKFSDDFSECKTGALFEKQWKSSTSPPTPEMLKVQSPGLITSAPSTSSLTSHGETAKTSKRGKLSKRKLNYNNETKMEELVSPQKKKIRPRTEDSELDSHRLGMFNLRWSTFKEPPEKWLDRPIDDDHVEDLVAVLRDNPCAMVNNQLWLGICQIPRDGIKEAADVKGCEITIIGGLHRKKAYKKASLFSKEHENKLAKVGIQLYDHKLTDGQIKRLAALHNMTNIGSKRTTWVERVHACRRWRFQMEGKDMDVDEVPQSSLQWRTDCQEMFVEPMKNVNVLESTLQTALLPRTVFNLWQEAAKMFDEGKLAGQNIQKRSSAKKPELTQNQLGMPLQGLDDNTKQVVLQRLTTGECSLKELHATCSSIKKKKKIQIAFCQHVGETSWEAVVARFPNHTSEMKLASFTDVRFSRGPLPEVLVKFFNRAIMWEKEQQHPCVAISGEREDIQLIEGKAGEIGILSAQAIRNLSEAMLKTLITNFKGFELSILELRKKCDIDELETAFMKIHSLNVETMAYYNLALVMNGDLSSEDLEYVRGLMEQKFLLVQTAYYVDSAMKSPTGLRFSQAVRTMILGHWSSTGEMQLGNFHTENSSNAFIIDKNDTEQENQLPGQLISRLMECFSYPEGWVLSKCEGAGVVGAFASNRNCFEVVSEVNFREVSKMVNLCLQNKLKHKTESASLADKNEAGEDEEYEDDELVYQ